MENASPPNINVGFPTLHKEMNEFSGMADRLAVRVAETAKKMSGTLEVGFLSGASYSDGTPVASVAFWNEFGTSTAPPRPFFRNMIEKENRTCPVKAAALAANDKFDGRKILEALGADIEGALKESIVTFTSPGLAASTIKHKGSAKPLIDTGEMLNSTGFRVT